MQTQAPAIQTGRNPIRPNPGDVTCIALDENELAIRWGLSVKTLRRWRQEQLGPIYCKLGRRVTYLLHEIEAFERRVSRYSSFTRAYQ
ncbi:AlpA family transcriptional regulator [Jeongeupia sp. USM3]|uniref:helix-turn-helix transcriptional regulator n=1 Tax=Jeongeupia sp. USM3 TaxID=1906741 RepID=UPI00089E0364|nr:hypothetical protein [Jeongeupia sp. USM3]AOX99851.1 hypothetical protein BJP62_04885 [Jeongeupia sp. USM3]